MEPQGWLIGLSSNTGSNTDEKLERTGSRDSDRLIMDIDNDHPNLALCGCRRVPFGLRYRVMRHGGNT
jgi:hypothetical protein